MVLKFDLRLNSSAKTEFKTELKTNFGFKRKLIWTIQF